MAKQNALMESLSSNLHGFLDQVQSVMRRVHRTLTHENGDWEEGYALNGEPGGGPRLGQVLKFLSNEKRMA